MIATVIERAGDQLGEFLPRLAGALLLLIVGLLAAIVLGRLTRRALVRAGLDRFADRSGTSELLGQAGLGELARRRWSARRSGSRSWWSRSSPR